MLAGAINTAIVGANGVLNRVSEDGVMTDWFRAPHRKYGTTYRMINLIVVLQLAAIIGSRGNTYTLGEAYAFGVIWSFAFKGLAMLVLRFKDRSHREWKGPPPPNIGGAWGRRGAPPPPGRPPLPPPPHPGNHASAAPPRPASPTPSSLSR